MQLGILKETFPGETRVAMTPGEIARLTKKNLKVVIEAGAGERAGYSDTAYREKGATVAASRKEVFESVEIIAQVRAFGSNPEAGADDLALLSAKHTVIGFADPLGSPQHAEKFAATGASLLAVELIPRISRAQSMDALSSMANLAGYRAVLLGAAALPKILPMMTTAAGTLAAAKVFVIGAGVAGLQAIATAKRLGAVVEAYDVRPEVAEQVQSVGGSFVDLGLDTQDAGDSGGYAKAQSEDFYKRQQEAMAKFIRVADIVITTAAIPGRKAPVLVTLSMMKGMKPGAVLVDLAAETGGNCEATKAGETIDHDGVQVMGPLNVPAAMPYHASQLYARNISTLVGHLIDKEGNFNLDTADEITAGSLVTKDGKVVHERVQQALAASSTQAAK